MANDLTKVPKQVIVDLVNAKTAKGFTVDDFDWTGVPAVVTGVHNTNLLLTAVPGSGYSGTQTIDYDRVHLQTNVGDVFVASGSQADIRNLIFTPPVGATQISDLIDDINDRLDIELTVDDYTDGPLPTFAGTPNEEHTVSIVAKAGSLPYRGELAITLKAADIPLSSVITNPSMDGLVYVPRDPPAQA